VIGGELDKTLPEIYQEGSLENSMQQGKYSFLLKMFFFLTLTIFILSNNHLKSFSKISQNTKDRKKISFGENSFNAMHIK